MKEAVPVYVARRLTPSRFVQVAAVYYKRGNLDSAVKLYEKLCALYAAERWNGLLAAVLPRLSECQRQLGDVAGHLGSCMRLLALEEGLLIQVRYKSSYLKLLTKQWVFYS